MDRIEDRDEEVVEFGVATEVTQGQGGQSTDLDLSPAQQFGISDQ